MLTRRDANKTIGLAITGGLLAGCGSEPASAQLTRQFRPEDFGAKGDGRSNDTAAFVRLATAVRNAGGGDIILARTTYIVGQQRRPAASSDFSFEPDDILNIWGCSRPVRILGNGGTLRAADNLRYGTFERLTGARTAHPLPFYRRGELATPYRAMIALRRNTGGILVEGLTLSGPVGRMMIGGPFGDVGHQIEGTGLWIVDNAGDEILRDLVLDRHPLDGLIIDGGDQPVGNKRLIDRVRCSDNGRQGASVIGGHGYRFSSCRFDRSGRAGIASPPGAGVDLEAESNKRVRAITFDDCDFTDNAGPGLLAESGDVSDVTVHNSRLVGVASWAAWPNKPGMRFSACTFTGGLANAHGDAIAERATAFDNCTFKDIWTDRGRRVVARGPGPIADLSSAQNVRFSRTSFLLEGEALLPWSERAIYRDCTMRQRSAKPSYPRGRYIGANRIDGNADIAGSQIDGVVVLNGRRLR